MVQALSSGAPGDLRMATTSQPLLPPTDLDVLRLEVSQRVALVTFNRPQVHNAISLRTMAELDSVLDYVTAERAIGALILTGAGDRSFASGGDLKEFDAVRTREQAIDLSMRMQRVMARLRACELPVIAALNGDAYGGGFEVAMNCDMRVASRTARVGFLQVTLGITPAWSGRQRIIEAVGRSRGLRFMLTGEVLSAEDACTLGLLDQVVEPAGVLPTATDLAHRIARHPPLAVRAIKRAVNRATQLQPEEAMRFEAETFADTWLSDDHWEALAARREKRAPDYRGQ
jgi:enoyl-CoA hydratase/carnithine racemase